MTIQEMKPSILLVEDDHEILEEIKEELLETFTVFQAFNGSEALSVITREHVSLVISDVMMPVMDGFELCKAIKSSADFCHIPVILLTAKNALSAKVQGLGLGADAYIDKPFDMEYLLAIVGTLLHNRKIVKEFFSPVENTHHLEQGHTLEDITFLQNLTHIIHNRIEDMELDAQKLSKLMGISRTNLFKKIKATTGLTPNDLVNITRLKKAADIFRTSNLNVSDVSNLVGYGSPTNFGRNFYKHFGMTPNEYRKSVKK